MIKTFSYFLLILFTPSPNHRVLSKVYKLKNECVKFDEISDTRNHHQILSLQRSFFADLTIKNGANIRIHNFVQYCAKWNFFANFCPAEENANTGLKFEGRFSIRQTGGRNPDDEQKVMTLIKNES